MRIVVSRDSVHPGDNDTELYEGERDGDARAVLAAELTRHSCLLQFCWVARLGRNRGEGEPLAVAVAGSARAFPLRTVETVVLAPGDLEVFWAVASRAEVEALWRAAGGEEELPVEPAPVVRRSFRKILFSRRR